MPERWERELAKLRSIEPSEGSVRDRVGRGPSPDRTSSHQRLIAGGVAVAVFVAAAAFAWGSLRPIAGDGRVFPGDLRPQEGPALSITANAEPGQPKPPEATARYGDVAATIPVQGGEGWGMGNAFPAAMFGPHEAAIPVGAALKIASNAERIEVVFDASPDGDAVQVQLGPDGTAQLPKAPGDMRIGLTASWPDGRAEFSVYVRLYEAVDELHLDCGRYRVPAQEPVVAAHADGVRMVFDAEVDREVTILAPGFTRNPLVTVEPGRTPLTIPLPPGIATIECNEAPPSQITVVDPDRLWVASELECPPGHAVVAVEGASQERIIDEARVVRDLLTLRASDQVRPPGYPDAVRVSMLPAESVVVRDGAVVATLDVWLGEGAHVEGMACASSDIRGVTTSGGSPSPSVGATDEIVVRIEGLGRSERSRGSPIMRVTFRGETVLGCTQGFEWTTIDGTKIDDTSEGSSLPPCSYEPLFVVPPRTPIVVVAEEGTEVFATRTTTPLYTGTDSIGAHVTWQDGNAEFLALFEVRYEDPVPGNIELGCAADDRIEFETPDGPRILPGGSAYIRGNMAGFLDTDVIEQMTRDPDGTTEWDGTWQVVRDGSVVAVVDFSSLGGVACRGSGIGGV